MGKTDYMARLDALSRKDCRDDKRQAISNLACNIHTMLSGGCGELGKAETTRLLKIAEQISELGELNFPEGGKTAGKGLGKAKSVTERAPKFRDRRWD